MNQSFAPAPESDVTLGANAAPSKQNSRSLGNVSVQISAQPTPARTSTSLYEFQANERRVASDTSLRSTVAPPQGSADQRTSSDQIIAQARGVTTATAPTSSDEQLQTTSAFDALQRQMEQLAIATEEHVDQQVDALEEYLTAVLSSSVPSLDVSRTSHRNAADEENVDSIQSRAARSRLEISAASTNMSQDDSYYPLPGFSAKPSSSQNTSRFTVSEQSTHATTASTSHFASHSTASANRSQLSSYQPPPDVDDIVFRLPSTADDDPFLAFTGIAPASLPESAPLPQFEPVEAPVHDKTPRARLTPPHATVTSLHTEPQPVLGPSPKAPTMSDGALAMLAAALRNGTLDASVLNATTRSPLNFDLSALIFEPPKPAKAATNPMEISAIVSERELARIALERAEEDRRKQAAKPAVAVAQQIAILAEAPIVSKAEVIRRSSVAIGAVNAPESAAQVSVDIVANESTSTSTNQTTADTSSVEPVVQPMLNDEDPLAWWQEYQRKNPKTTSQLLQSRELNQSTQSATSLQISEYLLNPALVEDEVIADAVKNDVDDVPADTNASALSDQFIEETDANLTKFQQANDEFLRKFQATRAHIESVLAQAKTPDKQATKLPSPMKPHGETLTKSMLFSEQAVLSQGPHTAKVDLDESLFGFVANAPKHTTPPTHSSHDAQNVSSTKHHELERSAQLGANLDVSVASSRHRAVRRKDSLLDDLATPRNVSFMRDVPLKEHEDEPVTTSKHVNKLNFTGNSTVDHLEHLHDFQDLHGSAFDDSAPRFNELSHHHRINSLSFDNETIQSNMTSYYQLPDERDYDSIEGERDRKVDAATSMSQSFFVAADRAPSHNISRASTTNQTSTHSIPLHVNTSAQPSRTPSREPKNDAIVEVQSEFVFSVSCIGVRVTEYLDISNTCPDFLECEATTDSHGYVFTLPQARITLAPASVSKIPLRFQGIEAGHNATTLHLSFKRVGTFGDVKGRADEHRAVVIRAEAQVPIIELQPSSELDFGVVSYKSKKESVVKIVNHSSFNVPLRLVSSQHTLFSIAGVGDDGQVSIQRTHAGDVSFVMGAKSHSGPYVVSAFIVLDAPAELPTAPEPSSPAREISALLYVVVNTEPSQPAPTTHMKPHDLALQLKARLGSARLQIPRSLVDMVFPGEVGKTITRIVPIRNSGTSVAEVVVSVEDVTSSFSVSPEKLFIQPNEEQDLSVSVLPNTDDDHISAHLVFHLPIDDRNYRLPLTASVKAAKHSSREAVSLLIDRPVVHWGAVSLGQSSVQTIVLRNNSRNLDLILRIAIEGADAIEFNFAVGHRGERVPHVKEIGLGPQEEHKVQLMFAPSRHTFCHASLVTQALPTSSTTTFQPMRFSVPLLGYGGSSHVEVIGMRGDGVSYAGDHGEQLSNIERNGCIAVHDDNDLNESKISLFSIDFADNAQHRQASSQHTQASPRLAYHMRFIVQNSGTQAAFVKIVATDAQRALFGDEEFQFRPSSFVLEPQTNQTIACVFVPGDDAMHKIRLIGNKGLKAVKDRLLSIIHVISGDEVLRQRFLSSLQV